MINKVLAVEIGQNTPLGGGAALNRYTDFGQLVSLILRNVFTVAGLILLVLLIVGGLMLIIGAGGDPKKAQQAQAIITDALIGFAVVFLSYFIVQIIQVITGVPIL